MGSEDASVQLLAAARALAVDRTTAEVVRAFAAADVPAILLKGPSLVTRCQQHLNCQPAPDTEQLGQVSE